jgi:hypothetical protein
MLRAVKDARANYIAHKEDEAKRLKEKEQLAAVASLTSQHEERKKENVASLQEREAKLNSELKATQKLLLDGNTQLGEALKNKDQALISVAQALLSTATSKMASCQAEVAAVMQELHNLQSCSSSQNNLGPAAKRRKSD